VRQPLNSFCPLVSGLFLLLACSGCAAKYHEPPPGGSATLTATAPVWIVSIDRQKVSGLGITGVRTYRVAPGEHLVELKYAGEKRMNLYGPGYERHPGYFPFYSQTNLPLKFFAEAGRAYIVREEDTRYPEPPLHRHILDPVHINAFSRVYIDVKPD